MIDDHSLVKTTKENTCDYFSITEQSLVLASVKKQLLFIGRINAPL